MIPGKREFPALFTLFVVLIVMLTMTLNMINGRFWLADFRVYYGAARALLAGGPVYSVSFDEGSGFYKYSPVILYFFLPYSLLSYKTASIVHFIILGFTYWYTFMTISDLMNKYLYNSPQKHGQLLLILAFICILIHFSREMYLGNINIVLMLLSCLALRNYLSGRSYTGSLFLGLAVLTKPFFIILLLPLLLRKQWKSMLGLAIVLITGSFLPFLYPGPGKAINLYSEWFSTIARHNDDFPDMNSVDYILRHYIFPSMPGYVEYIIILVAGVLAGWLIVADLKREKGAESGGRMASGHFIFEWFILLAILPSLIRIDWVQFLFAAPVITYIIFFISNRKKYFLIPGLVLLLFFFSANSDDLLGRSLSRKLLEMGVMGISNIFLVLMALFLFLSGQLYEHRGKP